MGDILDHIARNLPAGKKLSKCPFLHRVGSGGGGLGCSSYQEIRSLGTKGGWVMLQVAVQEYFSWTNFLERETAYHESAINHSHNYKLPKC